MLVKTDFRMEIKSMDLEREKLCEMASSEVESVLKDLPKEPSERVGQLPITFEHKPNEGLQADGIEDGTLGVFTGAEYAEEGQISMSPQIILCLENIWDRAEGDGNAFREEIRTTF
jgi:hypothetical protein